MLSTRRREEPAEEVARPRFTLAERKDASHRAAFAVLGGRFEGSVKRALKAADFAGSTRHFIDAELAQMSRDAVRVAQAAEQERLEEQAERLIGLEVSSVDLQRCKDPEYVAEQFQVLLDRASKGSMDFSEEQVAVWAQLFKSAAPATLREMAFQFQRGSWVRDIFSPRFKNARKWLNPRLRGEIGGL